MRLMQDRRVLERGMPVLPADDDPVVKLAGRYDGREAAGHAASVDEHVLELALGLEVEDDPDARLAVLLRPRLDQLLDGVGLGVERGLGKVGRDLDKPSSKRPVNVAPVRT